MSRHKGYTGDEVTTPPPTGRTKPSISPPPEKIITILIKRRG